MTMHWDGLVMVSLGLGIALKSQHLTKLFSHWDRTVQRYSDRYLGFPEDSKEESRSTGRVIIFLIGVVMAVEGLLRLFGVNWPA